MAEPITIDGINYDRYLGYYDQEIGALIAQYGGSIEAPAGATTTTACWRTAKIGPRWVLVTPSHHVWILRGLYKAFLTTSHPDNLGIWQSGSQANATGFTYTPPPQPEKIPFPNASSYGAMARYAQRRPGVNPELEMLTHECRRLRSWHLSCYAQNFNAKARPTSAVADTAASVFNAALYPTGVDAISDGGPGKMWWGDDQVASVAGNYGNPEGSTFYHFNQSGLYAGGIPYVAGEDPVKIVYRHLPSYLGGYATRIFMDVFDPYFRTHLRTYPDLVNTSAFACWQAADDGDYVYGLGHGHKNETGFPAMNSSAATRVQPHLGFLFLVANPFPTQQNGTIPGSRATAVPVVYQQRNQRLFTKLFMRDYLFTKYSGSLAALNAAWGSTYTSWDSDGGWQVGSGLLDENGRTSHTWLGTGGEPANGERWLDSTTWGAQVKIDLDECLYEIAKKYFSELKAAITLDGTRFLLYQGHSYIVTWGYPARIPVCQAAGEVLDIIPSSTAADPAAAYEYLATHCGDKPFINWMSVKANVDSGMYYLGAVGTTQQNKAQTGFIAPNLTAVTFRSAAQDTFPYVGYHWFEQFDMRTEEGAWGWMSRRWNPYDGRDYASAHALPDSLPGVAGTIYPTLAEDGPAYAATDPGLPYKVYGDFVNPCVNFNRTLPGILAVQYAADLTGPDVTAPSTPGTPTATIGSNSIQLTWSASVDDRPGPITYRVKRRLTSVGGAYTELAATTQTFFFDTIGLVPETSYDYQITAEDAVPNVQATPAEETFVTTEFVDTSVRVTETFTAADSATGLTADHTWSRAVTGVGFGITGNEARLQGVTGAGGAVERLDVDSDTLSHFIEATLTNFSAVDGSPGLMAGLGLRLTSSAADRYALEGTYALDTQGVQLGGLKIVKMTSTGGAAATPPTVQTRSDVHSASGATPTFTLPTGIAAGDLLIAWVTARTVTAFTWPAGWTAITNGALSRNTFRSEVRYRIADGTEGASIQLTLSGSVVSLARLWRIANHNGTAPVMAMTHVTPVNADPPALSVPWGSKPTLWIVGASWDALTTTAVTAYPATYTDLDSQHFIRFGTMAHVACEKTATAPSEDPGPFTNTTALQNAIVWTLAVQPLTAPDTPLAQNNLILAAGQRVKFQALHNPALPERVVLNAFIDGQLRLAAVEASASVLTTGLRGALLGAMGAATDQVAWDNVVFADEDAPAPPPLATPVVTFAGPSPATVPAFVAKGPGAASTGALSLVWPTHQANDLALAVIATANQETVPAGWTHVTGSPQGVGTPGTGARLAVFWKRAASSSEAPVSVLDSGAWQCGALYVFRGGSPGAVPYHVSAGDTLDTPDTAVAVPGGTTTLPNMLIVSFVADAIPSLGTTTHATGWANGDLTDVTALVGTAINANPGGGIGGAYGTLETPGTFGTTTATLAASSIQGRLALALAPPDPLTGVVSVIGVFTDPNAAGLAKSELYVNGVLHSARQPVVGLSSTHLWDTAALPDGVHTLRLDVTDALGQLGTATIDVAVANVTQRRVHLSFVELEVPAPPVTDRRVLVAFAELEVPDFTGTLANTWTVPLSWERVDGAIGYRVFVDGIELPGIVQPAVGVRPSTTVTFHNAVRTVLFEVAIIYPGPTIGPRFSIVRRFVSTIKQAPAGVLIGDGTFTP